MGLSLREFQKPQWMENPDIRPFIYMRAENRPDEPGTLHDFPWFEHNYISKHPLLTSEAEFGKQILLLDEMAFGKKNLPTPPWVFYDCAVMPGLIAGYVCRTEKLPKVLYDKLRPKDDLDWTPISLFMAIPTLKQGSWMAHNLASVNSFVRREERLRGLGFFTKAFALWFANIQRLYGITQWDSPALRLHPNYGDFELVTSYTPLHTYPQSLTYLLDVKSIDWVRILDKEITTSYFLDRFKKYDEISPKDEYDLRRVQKILERKEQRLFLWGKELLNKEIGEKLTLFIKKN